MKQHFSSPFVHLAFLEWGFEFFFNFEEMGLLLWLFPHLPVVVLLGAATFVLISRVLDYRLGGF